MLDSRANMGIELPGIGAGGHGTLERTWGLSGGVCKCWGHGALERTWGLSCRAQVGWIHTEIMDYR